MICRLIGHNWGDSHLLMSFQPREMEGNHRLTCSRCGEVVLCWYGHPVPNIGLSPLRHRFALRLHHWKV